MHIKRVYIDGFKRLTDFDLELNPALNIIVGDNETGKTSVLEAISLVLSRQHAGRYIDYALDPYLFNAAKVAEYIAAVRDDKVIPPPRILIEAYLCDDSHSAELARLKGTNNTKSDNCPGLSLLIEVAPDYVEELKKYVKDSSNPEMVPVEYYMVSWRSFAGNGVTARNLPFKATMIDTTVARVYRGPSKYVAQIVSDVLSEEKRRELSLAYKKLRHRFTEESGVAAINTYLEDQGKLATRKKLTVQMDMSSRSGWDSAITAHVDDLPFDCAGKGEQCRIHMRLAIAGAVKSPVLLIEEPENHLSHSNMNTLMEGIAQQCVNQQVIVTTHSAFVLNKLGIDNLKLISPSGKTATIAGLKPDTKDYFMRLPGYDTLRLVLSKRSILVEGPSDELIVQRAYKDKHGKLPLEDGVDVISVGSLAFKRFLEIATLLDLDACVVTDNDKDVAALEAKYKDYLAGTDNKVRIFYDNDASCPTLEPQLLKVNSLEVLNRILGTTYAEETALLAHMGKNKTDCALMMFKTSEKWAPPDYIAHAIK